MVEADFSEAKIKAAQQYVDLMGEVKDRMDVLMIALGSGFLPHKLGPTIYEYCFLQFRMLCELIALGCLVAHGDLAGSRSKSLRKTNKADYIINRLSDLHSRFFPIPQTMERDENGKWTGVTFVLHDGFLTKSELLDLYHLCGEHLHRGSLNSVTTNPFTDTKDHSETLKFLRETFDKMVMLLKSHNIIMFDPSTRFAVEMQPAPGERPGLHLMKIRSGYNEDELSFVLDKLPPDHPLRG